MKLSVIVVSYNVKGYLGLCLDSALVAMDRLGEGQSELIVFDNASSDGSAEWVSLNYPQVQVMESEENLGFSAGNNAAIRASKGEWSVCWPGLQPTLEIGGFHHGSLVEHFGNTHADH